MAFFHCLLIITIKTVSSQFAQHIDLEKVEEIILNGEKYNVLKPTVHKVTENFEDEKLRRDIKDNERVFIDDYGFRHFWKGIENRKSYDKNDIEHKMTNEDIVDEIIKGNSGLRRAPAAKRAAKPAAKPAAKQAAKPTPKRAAKPAAKPAVKSAAKPAAKPAVEASAKKVAKLSAKVTAKPASKPAFKSAAKPAPKPAAKLAAKPTFLKQELQTKTNQTTSNQTKTNQTTSNQTKTNQTAPVARERTVGVTHIFCPFFGVLAVKAFID